MKKFWTVLLMGLMIPVVVWGQQVPTDESEESAASTGVFPQVDREILKHLTDAQKLVELERYAEAVRKINEVLAISEDCLVPDEENKGLFRSLKTEAERLLEALPTRGLDLYELESGTTARQLLDEGIGDGDVAKISRVARQYFYTQAGQEAAFLLGMNHLDHQRPIPAAILLRKLYENSTARERFSPLLPILLGVAWEASGNATLAKNLIQEAGLEKTPKWKELRMNGQPVDQLHAADVVRTLVSQLPKTQVTDVLKNWELFRGNLQRNLVVQADMPVLCPIWRVSTLDNPEASAIVEVVRRYHKEWNLVDIPATVPLVVGDTVLVRTLWNLTAVDLKTGKRLWEVPSKGYEEVLQSMNANNPQERNVLNNDESDRLSTMIRLVTWRLWGEGVFGSLSSNGTLVFCVEDSLEGQLEGFQPQRGFRPMMGNVENEDSRVRPNRLAAYNIRSGKLIWHIGSTASEWSLPEPDTMFLGTPLPLGDELFVLGQQEGEVRLWVLDAATGKTKWKQTLCLMASGPQMTERTALSPSYANGILVCPTPNRTLVALDLAAHAILWGNTYEKEEQVNGMGGFAMGRNNMNMAMFQPNTQVDSSVLLAGNKVLYLPQDSPNLLCLNLSDGKEIWQKNTTSAGVQYIAAVTDKKVFLVGNALERWNLETGDKEAALPLPDGGASGFGYFDGKHYFLPTLGGSVLKIALDQDDLNIVATERASLGDVPGSLIPAGNWVLSQRAESLDAFVQRKDLEPFLKSLYAVRADSPEALLLDAMEHRKNGDLVGAVALLRKGGDYTKKPLLLVLMEGMETDFASFEKYREEIFSLLQTSEEKMQFYPRMIIGMEKSGRYDDAMAECHKLFEVIQDSTETLELREDDQCVESANQWLGLHLANLAEKTDAVKTLAAGQFAELREAFLKWSEVPVEKRNDAETTRLLERFRATRIRFAYMPFPKETRNDYVALLEKLGRTTELELFLLSEISDEKNRSVTYAALVLFYAKSSTPLAAVPYWKWLAKNAPEEKGLDGKTAKEWLDALPKNSPIRVAATYQPAWKPGQIVVTPPPEGQTSQTPTFYHNIPMELSEPVALPFQEIQVGRQAGNPVVYGVNAWGERLWTRNLMVLPGNVSPESVENFSGELNFTSNATLGHLLLLAGPHSLLAMDMTTMTQPSSDANILWRWTSRPRQSNVPAHLVPLVKRVEARTVPLSRGDVFPTSISGIISISKEYLCFLNDGKMTALNPITGTFLWERNLKKGSDGEYAWAFGNEQHVFLSTSEMGSFGVSMDSLETEFSPTLLKDVPSKELFAKRFDDSPRGKALQLFQKQFSLMDSDPLRVLDARTGRDVGKKRVPCSPFLTWQEEIDGKILLSYGDAEAFGLYDMEAEKFVWLYIAMKSKTSSPWQIQGGLVKDRGLLVHLDGESRAEIRDVRTGELLGKTESLLSEEQRKRPKQPDYTCWVGPDVDDGVLLTLSEIQGHEADPFADDEENPDDEKEEEEPKKDEVRIRVVPMYNVEMEQVYNASVFRFNREGKMLWEQPITEKEGYILTAVPSKMPLVGFAWTRNAFSPQKRTSRVSQIFRFYDQRNGRLILDMETDRNGGTLQLRGVPKEQKIFMDLPTGSVEFRFTDDPFTNEPPQPIRPDHTADIEAGKKQIADLEKQVAEVAKQIQRLTETFNKNEKPSPSDRMMYDNKLKQLERQKNLLNNQIQIQKRQLERFTLNIGE